MMTSNISPWAVLAAAGAAYVLYVAYWRLYLSPIAHFPGPRLAALTLLYEMYYDTWLGGQFEFKIIELHKKYGPILRISPWELHISDPDFYDMLYVGHSAPRRTEKYWPTVRYFGLDLCVFSTIDHDLHRIRRSALNPFFSMAAVRSLQPIIQERIDMAMGRMKEFIDEGKVLNATYMFSAFTNDVVETYCFARCQHRLEHPHFDPEAREAAFKGATSVHVMKHLWWLYDVMNQLPTGLVKAINTGAGLYLEQKRYSRVEVKKIISGENEDWRGQKQPTIFRAALEAKLPDIEKSVDRLSDDAQMAVMAGTLTTSMTLETIMYWLLAQPDTLRKLKKELHEAIPLAADVGSTPLAMLEGLPYLSAVIKEGLRLSYGASMRLQRIDPDNVIRFIDRDTGKEWNIPAKTPVGMSCLQIHHDESIYPNSKLFLPERWLGNEGKSLDKYFVSFSKGSRNCLGMHLSYGEMYLFLANVWRLWTTREVGPTEGEAGVLELFETTARDVEIAGDYYIPKTASDSKGVRIMVHHLKI